MLIIKIIGGRDISSIEKMLEELLKGEDFKIFLEDEHTGHDEFLYVVEAELPSNMTIEHVIDFPCPSGVHIFECEHYIRNPKPPLPDYLQWFIDRHKHEIEGIEDHFGNSEVYIKDFSKRPPMKRRIR